MKSKVWILIGCMLLLVLAGFEVSSKMEAKSVDEVLKAHNIDHVFHKTEQKGQTIVFYASDTVNNLSVGLIEKTFWGYRWSSGFGSSLFSSYGELASKAFSNLMPRSSDADEDLVSLTFGVIHDDAIEGLKIGYKNQDFVEATIIDTEFGRIWFNFTDTPINYDPKAIRVYEDGLEILGWY